MTNTNTNFDAAQEIDAEALDQAVGGGVMIPDARKQEHNEKLTTDSDPSKG